MRKLLMVITLTALFGFSLTANAATLIGHWGFEEGIGSTAYDSSGNNLNGTIYNASYAIGTVGAYALDFNGSNTWVQVGFSSLLNPQSIAISLWFKPRSTQNASADILDKGHGLGTSPYYGGYVFQYRYSGGDIDTAYGNGSDFPLLNTGGDYRDDVWHHIVANLGAAGMALYVDDVLIDSDPGQGSIVANDSDLYFGRHRYLGRYFNGLIDDVQIYDGPLSASQVDQIYRTLLLGLGLLGTAGARWRMCR